MHPKTFFETKALKSQAGRCFVLMPFATQFNEVYTTIKEAVESPEVNFRCKRADDIMGGGHIMESVLKEIGESEIVIADLTGRNPNVFYELGITHMMKDPNKVILLIQDIETMPFDLSPFRSIVYKQESAGRTQLKLDIQNAINEVADLIKLPGTGENPVYQFTVKNGMHYKFPIKLFGDKNCLYDFEIYGDFVGEDALKFSLSVTRYAAGYPPDKLFTSHHGLTFLMKLEIPKLPWYVFIHKISDEMATLRLAHN